MEIQYRECLTEKQIIILDAHGWKIKLLKPRHRYSDYVGEYASKDFKTPQDAMFEIEKLFGVDVIGDTDHDGASLHSFTWLDRKAEDGREWVSGWHCAKYMYDALNTPRETAIAYKELRENLQKARNSVLKVKNY